MIKLGAYAQQKQVVLKHQRINLYDFGGMVVESM